MAVWGRIAGVAIVLSIAGATVAVSVASGYTEDDETKTVASIAEILSASDGFAGDGFGLAVDVDGDVMVVGAFGAAYVFTRSNRQWSETVKLTVPNEPPGWDPIRVPNESSEDEPVEGLGIRIDDSGTVYGGFGRSVAVDGDVIVVGAYEAAYVYTAVEDQWVGTAKLTGPDDLSGLGPNPDGSHTIGRSSFDRFLEGGFGSSVALDGDVIVVGANGVVRFPEYSSEIAPSDKENLDSVYVFTRNEDNWRETARLVRPAGPRSYDFGTDLDVNGNVLVVGGHSAAFVYERSGDEWSEPTELFPVDRNSSFGFGQSVAASADFIAVSSWQGVHVFERSFGVWVGEILEPFFDPDYYRFGLDVDLDSNLMVITPRKDIAGSEMTPIVFSLFDRPRAGWRVTRTSGYGSRAWRVQSVAIGGGVIALGAHLSTYEAGEDLVWRTTHQEPGVVHTHNLHVLEPVGGGVAPTETPVGSVAEEQPTAIAEPTPIPPAAATPTATATQAATAVATPTATATQAATAVATPTATAVPTSAVAQPVLVDDDDSSDGGVNLVWAGVIIAILVLVVLVIANFVMRRKPSDDAGRYTT